MTAEKYRCRGCVWTCLLTPNTEIVYMPKKCPFEHGYEVIPQWEREVR